MAFKSVKISPAMLQKVIDDSDKSIAMIARAIGISSGTISNWLNAKEKFVGINPEVFSRLIDLLGVPSDAIKIGGNMVAIYVPADVYAGLVAWADRHSGKSLDEMLAAVSGVGASLQADARDQAANDRARDEKLRGRRRGSTVGNRDA